nr:glycosyltransferase [uncultured Moellerella sp.]
MVFDEESNVTIVLTSCGRFDLLKKTLESLDKFNSYPIKKVIITEDSGNDNIKNHLPEHWKEYTFIIINNPRLGQIKSIDLAYKHVDSEYIFHCEDDWLFYRTGFIEESISVLENNKNIVLVSLRDFDNDIKINYPDHYLGDNYIFEGISCSRLCCTDNIWGGFSFNPGLRRMSDYLLLAPYYNEMSSDIREKELSIGYLSKGMFIAILKESAVKHIGWEQHVLTEREIKEQKKKIKTKIKYSFIGFLVGCIFMAVLFFLFYS